MFLLIRWWQTGSVWRGLFAGLLIGYACLIRYTEGLLVLPMIVAAASRVRWRDWRSYARSAIPGIAWGITIASLFIFNRVTLGTWTGYDSTNESRFGAAFTWTKFVDTWEMMLRTLHDTSLFFVFPLGIAGLAMLFRRSWQLGLAMLLWFIPGVALYTSYYFAIDRGVVYARFILTFLPAVLVGVAVCFGDGIGARLRRRGAWASVPLILAMGIVTCVSASVGLYRSLTGMQDGRMGSVPGIFSEYRERQSLSITGKIIAANVPGRSVLFVEGNRPIVSPIHYIQFMGDWDLYVANAFTPQANRKPPGGGMWGEGPDAPTVFQAAQRTYMDSIYKNKSRDDLQAEQVRVTGDAIAAGRRVFVAGSKAGVLGFQNNFPKGSGFKLERVTRWKDLSETDVPPIQRDTGAAPRAPGTRAPSNRRERGGGGGAVGFDRLGNMSWELWEVKRIFTP